MGSLLQAWTPSAESTERSELKQEIDKNLNKHTGAQMANVLFADLAVQ
jgi:prepilin-type processing-associated H-X9-DG protein